jgi:hypothetical protein
MPKKPVSFLLFLLFFTSCRKDLLHWQSVQQIKVGTNEQLNTALFLPNGIGMIGALAAQSFLFLPIKALVGKPNKCLREAKAFSVLVLRLMARSIFAALV